MAEPKRALFSGNPSSVIKDTDVLAYKEEGGSGDPTRNGFMSAFKTYFQGLLPSRITTNENDIASSGADIADHESRLDTLEEWNQLEAGAEFILNGSGTLFMPVICRRLNDDQLRLVFTWPDIPKQGTDIAISSTGDIIFVDGEANPSTVLGDVAYTTSNFQIEGKLISVYINQTGIANGVNNGPVFMKIAQKTTITITG